MLLPKSQTCSVVLMVARRTKHFIFDKLRRESFEPAIIGHFYIKYFNLQYKLKLGGQLTRLSFSGGKTKPTEPFI